LRVPAPSYDKGNLNQEWTCLDITWGQCFIELRPAFMSRCPWKGEGKKLNCPILIFRAHSIIRTKNIECIFHAEIWIVFQIFWCPVQVQDQRNKKWGGGGGSVFIFTRVILSVCFGCTSGLPDGFFANQRVNFGGP
jgi:hypothetical protein